MERQRWLDYAVSSKFPSLSRGNVTIYPESHLLYVGDRNVRCTRTHLRMLMVLLSNFCKTVSYEELLEIKDRQLNEHEQNLLNVQLFHLRRLLRSQHAELEIRNVYGEGYQARPRT